MSTPAITPSVKLNLAVTRVNLNNDSELILAIANIFVEDLPGKVLALQSAFDRNDNQSVVHLAHTIRGLASNFLAEPLTLLTQKLESEYMGLSDPEREMLISEIVMTSERTISAMKVEMENDLLEGCARCEDN